VVVLVRLVSVVSATAAAVCAAALTAGPSRADGDPPSDLLLQQNVYVPYRAPSQEARRRLQRAVAGVYAGGDRVKVALVYDQTDLGSVTMLFGHPAAYARFLGLELASWYAGPLLVAMPAGFGIYDGGRPVTQGNQILASIRLVGPTPDDLTVAATAVLERLSGAGALRSPDTTAPFVTVYPASARRGGRTNLRFDLFDDSGRSRAIVRVYEDSSLLAALAARQAFKIGTRHAEIRWPVPAKLHSRRLRFCVVASDPTGNRSAPACAPFLRIR
jgi:hypothetical protein